VALGNTPRRETNISVEASKSYALGMRFIMEDGAPVDITGCIVRLVMAEPPQRGNTEVLNLVAFMDAPLNGLCSFRFQAEDLAVEPYQYAFDITLVPPSGYSTPILKGFIDVGPNTDLDDTNVYSELNSTSDVTVTLVENDVVQIVIERVDGMFLVVSALIVQFEQDMQAQVDAAAASAQASLNSANLSASYAQEMQVWLDNAGYPFWKGTQAQYDLIAKKGEFLYLITDEAVGP
jgi:hypothetical protein